MTRRWYRIAPELLPVPVLLAVLVVLCLLERDSPASGLSGGFLSFTGRQLAMLLIALAAQGLE